MSELTATEIPKPTDEQSFERANEVLWRCILDDESVKLHGRRGQAQFGVDLTGYRGGKPEEIVGVQCKLKGDGKFLIETEVRTEVQKALKFKPLLSEYFICTTAPDDSALDSLAHDLSISCSKDREKPIKIRIFGWGSLQREIRRYAPATKAFDPSHTPHGDLLLEGLNALPDKIGAKLDLVFGALGATITERLSELKTADISGAEAKLSIQLEHEIDGYAELISTDPGTALTLFQKLSDRLDAAESGRIRFRIEANIAACHFELGDEQVAADGFIAASDHDPDNPKAASKKALGLLIKGDWPNLKAFARGKFATDPDNPVLAAYLIQGAISDTEVVDPLPLVPECVRNTPEVAHALIRWSMERGEESAWWDVCIAAHAAHPDNESISENYASALLDRVLTNQGFLYGRVLDDAERSQLEEVVSILQERWSQLRDSRGRDDRISVPLNLMVANRLLHRTGDAVGVGREALRRFPSSEEVKERLAAALFEHGDKGKAEELVSSLPINRETAMMRFDLAINAGDWKALLELVDRHLEEFPELERGLARAGRVLASVELANPSERRELLKAHEGEFERDARACMILSQVARMHGEADLSETYFSTGRRAVTMGDDSFAARMFTADEAMKRGEPGIAAELLSGRVPLDRDGPELRLLAEAFAYDFQ